MRAVCLACAWLLVGLPTAQAVEYRVIDGAGGLPLQLAEAGNPDKPGLLFIHGATLSSSSWLQQLESPLADDWHLVAFDLRGHGNSGKSWDPADYADSQLWADDVDAVMAATGLSAPTVVAWSYGGHVTMDFLRHYPASRLSGVVFVGSTGGMLPFPPPNPETAQAFARLGKLALSPAAGDRLEAARGFVNGMVVAPVAAGVIDREVAAVLAVTPYVRKAMSGRTLDNSDLVGRLQMPVLFVLGDGDRTATPAGVNSLIAQLPAARLSVYPDTGHMPFIERRERFNAELAAFAASVFEAPAIQGGTPP